MTTYLNTQKVYFPFLLAVSCVFVLLKTETTLYFVKGVSEMRRKGERWIEPPGRGP